MKNFPWVLLVVIAIGCTADESYIDYDEGEPIPDVQDSGMGDDGEGPVHASDQKDSGSD